MATDEQATNSLWSALKNRVFFWLWTMALITGCCVSAHDTAATWLMNELGAPPFLLSLMATSFALPFFLFAFLAGAISDLADRQTLIVATYIWQAAVAGLLAFFTWPHFVNPHCILIAAFLLGIGYAFAAPAWAAIIPEVVPKSQLPSAIILSGIQMNLSGIIGPALGGVLLSITGAGMVFLLNTLAFVVAVVMIARVGIKSRPKSHLEGLLESFASAVRYVRYTSGIQVILTRDFAFGFFISVVPALLPVVAFRQLHLQANQLGLSFTSLGIGSLVGGSLVLPYARTRLTPNSLTIMASLMLVPVFVLMAVVSNLWAFLPIAALAGISWTISASELWIAGQRAMPDWARGRMNAVHMMVSQGGVALGGVLWGWSASSIGLGKTLMGGAIFLSGSIALAIPLSINFAHSLDLESAPLEGQHNFPFAPKPDDGPVTITTELIIAPENREKFLVSIEQVRLVFLRNGAFLFNIDEDLERPGTFRAEMFVRSWAEHLRQLARITRSESETLQNVLRLHSGSELPVVRHYLRARLGPAPLSVGQVRKLIEPWRAKAMQVAGESENGA